MDARIGSQLAGYRIQSVLGRGGMGVVYLAEDLRLHRMVALKVLLAGLGQDEGFRARFARESEIAAGLEHPNVVPIYEAGEADGELFIAMRYIRGVSLEDLLRAEGRLEPDRALAILSQVASGLDEAHANGLVHRDVKPANVLIAPGREGGSEHVYLSDFGLTKRRDSATGLTRTGQFLGTVAYVAPEQIEGQHVDGRADVYSLGCVLFQCLTGEVPFPKDSEMAVMWAHVREAPPKATALRSDLSERVDAVVAKAMSKTPGARYPSCGALTAALAGTLALEGKGPGRTMAARFRPPRGIRTALAAAGVTVAVIVGLVTLVLRRGGPGGPVAAGSVGFLQVSSGRLTGQVRVGDAPQAIAVGAGAVWVTEGVGGTLARIDPRSGEVRQRIQVGDNPSGVAVSAGHVWVADGNARTVSDVNPGSGPGEERVVAKVTVGNGPLGIAAEGANLWVANSIDATVSEIDARSGEVLGTHPVGALPTGVAAGGGSVWVTERGADAVAKVDASTGNVVQEIKVGRGPTGIAWGANAVWVANTDDGTVSRVDPDTGSVTATVPVGTTPVSVALAGGGIWVANAGDGTISELDPAGDLLRTIPVRNAPRALTPVGDSVWVANQASPASHRGGTLDVAAEAGPDSLDPGGIRDLFELNLRAPIYATMSDGLVTVRRVGGIGGSTVVPDLAATLPVPTDQGRTYTFVLRPGVRFSTGAAVTPTDVKATFERLLSQVGAAQNIFVRHAMVIEGAEDCSGRGCDLSGGIEVNDASRTVTFRLTEPDPDFLRHLALPSFVILPAETSVDLGTTPPPATGPYKVSSFAPGSLLVLERNPEFRRWSSDAQPPGFPDRIVFHFGMTPDQQVAAVASKKIDVMYFDFPSAAALEELETRSPRQVHPASSLTTLGFFLNVQVPPFDDVRARQAVAFALDREELARLFSEERPGLTPSVTCNVIAPNLPGYVPYCPHTLDPNELGTWSGPDVSTARTLVRASGTSGMDVTVWSLDDLASTGRAVTRVLDSLGYRASLKLLPGDGYDALIRDPSTKAQIGIVGFDASSGSPSEFIRDAFHCPGPGFHPPVNVSQFCDRAIDARIDEALALQQTDQYAAARAWAALDHDLVDLAPVVNFAIPGVPRVVSARVGNYQANPLIGVLLDQLWVR